MSLQIDLQVDVTIKQSEQAAVTWIEQALVFAAEVAEQDNVEVSVRIVDNQTIHELNQIYRQVDQATDVLSFPQWEPDEEQIVFADDPLPLGDIVISWQKAKEQAAEYGHSLERELGFLSVHGFLHLLGFDHHTDEDSRVMFAKQDEILQRIGLNR